MMPAQIPDVGRMRPIKIPPHAETRLRTGLRILAIRRPTVPRVEIRLRIPAGGAADGGDGARARLLPQTILTGTEQRDSVAIARELQRLGATLDAAADADDLIVHAGTLSSTLPQLLDLTAEIVAGASFPADEIEVARDRIAQEIMIQRSQSQALAAEAMRARLFGKHRYGRGLPKPEAIRRLGAAPVRRFFSERVHPRGSTLVLVGDLSPDKAVTAVEAAFRSWSGKAQPERPAPPPPPRASGALRLLDRPGSVQTTIRLGGAGLPRSHPEFFKLSLANMVFGGYFSSRLNKNIREEKGYTYGARSVLEHRRGASVLLIDSDVGAEVTASALLEMRYELGRMLAAQPSQEELDQARRFLAGATSLSIQTQGGLASYADGLLAAGLTLDYLTGLRAAMEAVTTEDVHGAATTYLAPRRLQAVLVGDAASTRASLEAFEDVEVLPAR